MFIFAVCTCHVKKCTEILCQTEAKVCYVCVKRAVISVSLSSSIRVYKYVLSVPKLTTELLYLTNVSCVRLFGRFHRSLIGMRGLGHSSSCAFFLCNGRTVPVRFTKSYLLF